MGKMFDLLRKVEKKRIRETQQEPVGNVIDDNIRNSKLDSLSQTGTDEKKGVGTEWLKKRKEIFNNLLKKKKIRRTRRASSMEKRFSEQATRNILQKPSEKEGWVSPHYTQSRSVALEPLELLANRCVGYLCGSYESESYKVLRTQILQKTGKLGGTTVMITSALPGEGKTLTAVNLALTFAKDYNHTVMLVDSDLRQQKVHEFLGYESTKGLSDYLQNSTPLSDLIVWPGIEKLTVISGGDTVIASSELLNSPRMKDLVKDLKSRYPDRYVFFDAPPVLVGADAQVFATQVDYIIFIVRAGSTSIADIGQALELLPQEKILGVVLNRAEEPVEMIKEYYAPKKKGRVENTS